MSIDTAKVHVRLLQDAATKWQLVNESVRPYCGELEVEAAVTRLLNKDHTPLDILRLLVTLIAPKETE